MLTVRVLATRLPKMSSIKIKDDLISTISPKTWLKAQIANNHTSIVKHWQIQPLHACSLPSRLAPYCQAMHLCIWGSVCLWNGNQNTEKHVACVMKAKSPGPRQCGSKTAARKGMRFIQSGKVRRYTGMIGQLCIPLASIRMISQHF